jgi:DNA-directed RNA polymerase III subunit RPC3
VERIETQQERFSYGGLSELCTRRNLIDVFVRYVDLRKAYATLLRNAYKTLYNLEVRRQTEAEEPLVKAILEKSQRSDVSQDVERLLTRNEREELTAWEKRRDELTLVEMRVEEMVFILRTLGNTFVDDEL